MAAAFLDTVRWPLLTVGALSVVYHSTQILSFLQLHLLRGCQLDRYKSSTGDAWALVTGATDGIGNAFAEELARRGFNVILHGRNEQKLQDVKSRLEQSHPARRFRTVRIDAGTETNDPAAFRRVADELKDINLRILINNVGGGGGMASFVPLQNRPSDEVQKIMDMNARFPIEITKALLPQLQKNQPSLIMNIGSSSSEFGIPYLGIYAGCKSANKAWSNSLAAEMRAEGWDIEVLFILVSSVSTEYVKRAASLFVPNAKQMASSALDKVGCGKRLVFGYWAHEIQARFFMALPTFVQEQAVIDIGKKEKALDEERQRKDT